MKIKIGLKCEVCNDINYSTTKNDKTFTDKMKIKKYCSRDNKRTLHTEVKLKSSNK